MTHWQIRIQDPSGENRSVTFTGEAPLSLGRSENADVHLRDPLVAPLQATLTPDWPTDSSQAPSLWFTLQAPYPETARLGDLEIRAARLQPGVSLRLGESRISLEPMRETARLPEFPSGVRPWLTRADSGARLLWLAKKAAPTPLSVYIAGETGTGKEVIASLLHAWSDRASGPFVPLHCGALAASLAESELFGHLKGSFTGADRQRTGALMAAHGGTLFLDEVGDLSPDLQVKLLRFLENGEIRPVGSDRIMHADARVVCATHHPLKELVEAGKFRRDLYYRLASVTLEIPTLRSRPEDIEELAIRFAAEFRKTISPAAILMLKSYRWPGNVRELRHAIERACGLAGILSEHLDRSAFEFLTEAREEDLARHDLPGTDGSLLTLEEMERMMVLRALRLSRGNRTDAARVLGIARSTLFEMLKRHRIAGPRTTHRLSAAERDFA